MKFTSKCFIASTVIAVTLRTLQIFFFTEIDTAFFSKGKALVNVLLTVAVALPIIYTAVNALIAVRQPKTVGTGGTTFSVFIGISALLYLIGGITAFTSGRLAAAVTLILSLITAVGSAVFAVSSVRNIKFPKIFTVLFIVGWTAELILTYLCFNEHPLRARAIYEILAVCSIILFYIFFGKAFTKVSAGMSFRLMYPMGLLTGMLTAVSVIPEFIAELCGKGAYTYPSPAVPYLLLAAAAFAVTVTLSTFRKSNTKRHKTENQ